MSAILLMLAIFIYVPPGQSRNFPWSPQNGCALNPARPEGLHPDGLVALEKLGLAHRITQGLNNTSTRRNVHYRDGSVGGRDYTGAVDISVRCLNETQIRMLLEQLAEAGFAGWYRKDGEDDWSGPPHIHAIFTGCRLKPILRQQVESWLSGRNGLGPNRYYRFWQPSTHMKESVRRLYRRFQI